MVIGSGPIGCLHVRLARSRGARRVFLVELSRERLELAAERVQPDEAIVGSEVDPVTRVLELTGGRIGFFGGLPKDDPVIALDSDLVHDRELMIIGADGSSPDHNKRALDLTATGAVPVADLITHRLPLEQVLDGIGIVSRGEAIKVTIEP